MCTGYGSRDGNNINNFAMPWNIDKIFGILEDLMDTIKATKHFFDSCKNRLDMHVLIFSF